MTDCSDAGAVERLIADVGRLASALEAILARCRSASADLNADKSVPSVKQAIALDEIRANAAHHLAGIGLVRANAAALALPAPVVEGDVAEMDDADIITFASRFFDPTDNGYGADTRKWVRAVRAALSEGRTDAN